MAHNCTYIPKMFSDRQRGSCPDSSTMKFNKIFCIKNMTSRKTSALWQN